MADTPEDKQNRKTIGREEQFGALSIRVPLKGDSCDHESPLLLRRVKRTRKTPTRDKPLRFASLHHHSTYSYLDGYGLPEAHVRRATEINMPAMAITEHGNVSSHVRFEQSAIKEGVKPIFGCELYCRLPGPEEQQRKNHLTVLAETQAGYQNLLRLVGKTWSEGFYYEPTASGGMLSEHKEGLIVLSGCSGSLLFTSLVGGKGIEPEDASYVRGRNVARRFKRTFGDRYFLEVQAFPELEDHKRANPMIAQIGEELGIPLVATFDCHYTIPEEKELQQVLHNIRPGEKRTLEDMARQWGYKANLCPPWNDNMVLRKLIGTGLTRQQGINAILASEEIAQQCTVELPSLPMVRYPLPRGFETPEQLWRDWLKKGWEYRGCDKMPLAKQREYKKRLKHEIRIIEGKDFVDYFLIVSDAVRWAKDHDIAVGPARGSAAGSLACWLLRITEVNPMLYPDLVFERFIDVTRQDLPDIDLDFDSERRSEVRDYLIAKYGRECVNNVGTFSTFKAKMALDDAARVFHVPKWEVEKIKDVLIERSSGDLRASATIEDTAMQFDAAREVFEKYPDLGIAMDLEGNVKGLGVHAAGLVVSTGPIDEVCAVYERESKGELVKVISMDKYDAEKKGLLKLDFLGLNTVTMLNNIRLELGWSLDDLYNIDLEDEVVTEAFGRNDVSGIFQIEGRACRYVNGALQPDSFWEVCLVNALGRPGPLHNGSANEYIDIKFGRREPDYMHDAMIPITEQTRGQVVYQEQILRILQHIGGFDHTHRSEVRRIISRKIGEQEFNRRWQRFYDGAKELHDMDEETARRIWGMCITAGSYAFNAAHSVAYGMIAWHSQYFKQYETELFFKHSLRIREDDDERQSYLIRDAVRGNGPRKKIGVHNPDPQFSEDSWTQRNGSLQAGFVQIPGIGKKTAQAIMDYRDDGGFKTWDNLMEVKGIGPKTVEKMQDFVQSDDPFGAFWLDNAIAATKEDIRAGKLGPVPRPSHTASDIPYVRGDDIQVVWLGTVHTRNVRDLFEFNQAKGAELDLEKMTLNGKPIKDPHLREWCVMVGDDETDQMGLNVDRWKYPRFRDLVWRIRPGRDLVLVQGKKPGWMPTRQIQIHNMWLIDPEV